MACDVARLDDRAVGIEAQPIDGDDAGERAVRAFDEELAVAALERLAQRPMQAGLGAEQPRDEAEDGNDEEGEYRARGDEGTRSQKPYPTEKCSLQSLFSAPYARSARIGPIGVRTRTPPP